MTRTYRSAALTLVALSLLRSPLSAQADAEVGKRIKDVLARANRVRVDGKAGDWAGIPSFEAPPGDAPDPSRRLVRVAIAPRENDLLVMLATAGRPSRDDLAFWFNVDFTGSRDEDYQVGLSRTGRCVLWVAEKGRFVRQTELRGVEVAVGEVVEARVPYAALRKALPKEMAAALSGPGARSWVRVYPFTLNTRTKQIVDWGPAVASYRLLAADYPLDPPLPRPGKAARAVPLPLEGRWLVGQGAFGTGSHQGQWAYDFYLTDATLRPSRPRDSKRNEDYYSFGKKVLAPLGGRALRALDREPDGPPRAAGPERRAARANEVLLGVGDGLALNFVHIKKGSAAVRAGQVVRAGQELAEVGNSGFTSWPHLHLSLWRLPDGKAPLPVALGKVRVGLNPVGRDPWARELERWDVREGFFVERVGP